MRRFISTASGILLNDSNNDLLILNLATIPADETIFSCLHKGVPLLVSKNDKTFLESKNINTMSITKESELTGMKKASEAVALTLKEMRKFAKPGITTKELDDYGGQILSDLRAKSAPYLTYGFPGWTCISVNNEFCHGIPSEKKILEEGDLINIDVSAELDGFWSDNGDHLFWAKM